MSYTVVIAGPLNKISLSNLEHYKTIGKIVISHWNTDDTEILDSIDLTGCTVVSNDLPKKIYYIGSVGETFTYQVFGIWYGIREAKTPYVIRTRSDEYYNLKPLIERFEQDPTKILCGNIFFRPWSAYGFHLGDHLFIARTQLLNTAFEDLCLRPVSFMNGALSEQSMSWAMLSADKLDRTKEDFIKLFDVIDIHLLRPFIASWVHAGATYINFFDDAGCIKDIKQL